MILEKHPILLVLALRFLCALCDDDAPMSRGTSAVSAESDYDFGSTKDHRIYDLDSMENSLASHGSAITTFYGSSVERERLTTDSQLVTDDDGSSSSTTVDRTTKITTVSNDVTSTDNMINTTICDPIWPVNASGN